MVHGIGQRLEKSNLVDDVTNFRHITSSLAEKHLTSYQCGTQRVLFIPCQWRKGLKLSGESAVESITLDGVRGLRTMLSATVHDVLYYMSPIYCQDIINSVSNQLNRLYLKFLKRNPGYDGKVSIYGHSLGSVLSYDILCHQENLSSPFPMDWMYRKHAREDESPRDILKISSQCEPKADVTEASQEDLDGENLERQHVPSNLENEDPRDPDRVPDDCPGERIPNRECNSESQPGTSVSATEDQLCNHSDMISAGVGVSGDGNDYNREIVDGLQEKVTKPDISDAVAKPGILENVAEDQLVSNETDEDTNISNLKAEVDFLRARVAELEEHIGMHNNTVSQEMHTGTSYQDESGKDPTAHDDSPKSYKPFIKYTKLEFKVDTFFAVGSPLGVFLALRNVRIGIGEGKEYWGEDNIIEEMPACQRMFNIFHPFDPVAYRVEPLVCKEYVSKRPVVVPYHKGGKRLHIGFQDFKEDLAARSQCIVNHLSSVRVKVLTVCQSKRKENLEEVVDNVTEEKRSYGSFMMERLTGSEEGRIDHVLQDKTFQHPYISAIGSHTNYWRDYDTALFILKHLYGDIPEDREQLILNKSRSKDESISSSWSESKESKGCTEEIPEEELPLTFSDHGLTRSYSKKTKKIVKTSW